jgi:hypothetical protein
MHGPNVKDGQVASITTFRGAVRQILRGEVVGARRDVVILALDGVPHALAAGLWRRARIEKMHSVFPATSSSAWLSCLTGADVSEHGIPGVVFRLPGAGLVNLYRHREPLVLPVVGNIFSDAAEAGYAGWAIPGDLHALDCSYVDALLAGASRFPGQHFYTAKPERPSAGMARAVEDAVARCLDNAPARPCLVWCFVEVDLRIHASGYDDEVIAFVQRVDALAQRLAARGAVVVAHSDHGLVPTRHEASIAALLSSVCAEFACSLGGAGRTRWVYVPPRQEDRVAARLRRELPANVHLYGADEVFAPGSLARERVGELVLIARGEQFIVKGGQRFEHGSDTRGEVEVPFAVWG